MLSVIFAFIDNIVINIDMEKYCSYHDWLIFSGSSSKCNTWKISGAP